MGVLKKLTSEYFGDTERKEDMIELPDWVERVDFTDRNGVRHKKGYRVVKIDDTETIRKLIIKLIGKRGPKCDLNDIDVSKMWSMKYVFHSSSFNGDISGWDVSGVRDMNGMFFESKFNGDISKWDVSEVKDMHAMFAYSSFTGENGSISGWKVSKVEDMSYMFAASGFNGSISGTCRVWMT